MRGKTYFGRVMISLDQLGNALSGGNEDSTISARLGYLYVNKRGNFISTFLMYFVDGIFSPIDGEDHCRQAYEADIEGAAIRGNDVGLVVMGLFVIPVALILFVPILIYSYFVNKQ